MYLLDRCQLNLTIAEAKIQQPKQSVMSAVLFSGSFSYGLGNSEAAEDKLEKLIKVLSLWQSDLISFRDIVKDKFLAVTPRYCLL